MGDILFTSNNCFYVISESGVKEFSSEKIAGYCNTLKNISRRNEWKTSGSGAKFMNSYVPEYDDDVAKRETSINGASFCGNEVIYTANLGEVSGIFRKVLDKDEVEGLVMTSRDMRVYRISALNGKCAASLGSMYERHIAIVDIDSGAFRELTEGEVREDYPSYSRDGSKIFYSSAGLALSHNGIPFGVGPCGIFCYDIENNEMDELFASDRFDFFAPKEDGNGDMLYIKRPYRSLKSNSNILIDFILFPVRIIKAIIGLLNFFSIAFGGESLRSGQSARDVKSKQMSEKDLFFDGNVINSQQVLKENQRRGEKFPGIIPQSWELTRLDKNGNQVCVKKGVMDYVICRNGDIVYSNGNAVIRLSADGNEQLLEKCRMASNLVEM